MNQVKVSSSCLRFGVRFSLGIGLSSETTLPLDSLGLLLLNLIFPLLFLSFLRTFLSFSTLSFDFDHICILFLPCLILLSIFLHFLQELLLIFSLFLLW
jgi:hypothetical protein